MVEQIAQAEAPVALNLLAQKIDALEAKIASMVGTFENTHPIAAKAIVDANALLLKLFPQSASLITDAERLDL